MVEVFSVMHVDMGYSPKITGGRRRGKERHQRTHKDRLRGWQKGDGDRGQSRQRGDQRRVGWVSGKVAVSWEVEGKGPEVELGSQRSTSVRAECDGRLGTPRARGKAGKFWVMEKQELLRR